MAEWLVERGIGEDRAVLVRDGQLIAAKLDWPGRLAPGLVEDAVLIHRATGSKRGTARFANGEEALVDGLPQHASQGAAIRLRVVRSAVPERHRAKAARARPTNDPHCAAPGLDRLPGARVVRRIEGWEEVWLEAWDGLVPFAGGSLVIEPTAAMTVIDIDGNLPPRELALEAVREVAGAIRRLDLSGPIGIDFPGLTGKADRRVVDEALAAALADWPHEATAMNGFGFVQLVARMERPSLLQRIQADRPGAAARLLLRRAEAVADPGMLLLACHPAVAAAIDPDWLADLRRRTGRSLRLEPDAGLALSGGFAQAVSA